MKTRKHHVNAVVLQSIPIDKELKRFFLRKFNTMVDHNGQAYACAKMKDLRETLLGYRADPKRFAHQETWLKRTGLKVNGWLRKLFMYMDTQPDYALQFVKLYCGPNEPIVSVGSAAEAQHRALADAQRVDSTVPAFMQKWVHHVARQKKISGPVWGYYQTHLDRCPDWLRNVVSNHTYAEYEAYIRKWKRILWFRSPTDEELRIRLASLRPTAEMYVDYKGKKENLLIPGEGSVSLQDDWRRFRAMEAYLDAPYELGGSGLTSADYSYLLGLMSSDAVWSTADELEPLGRASFDDGMFVGQIHHIPKKGTVKRRSVAPPNRFIQWGMAPVDLQLELLLKNLERARDCTFNQTRLNGYISNRVNNDSLYVGSVDLHQATDFLPFEWMISIWSEIFEGRVKGMVNRSWRLFCHASRGAWSNEGYRDRWTTGQPLGALPSFKCLAITHNLLLESMCFLQGLLHSPYVVLGDDLVIMNRKVRATYIRLMTNAGVPLSLNKSYAGRLVEFAGQFFTKGAAPFYNTDQRALTWNSLFDYQWATGIHIPYSNLPRKLQRKMVNKMVELGLPRDYAGPSYEASVVYGMPKRGTHVSWTGFDRAMDLIPAMALQLDEAEDGSPDPTSTTGLTYLPGGHPVTFSSYDWAEKDGYFQRYRKVESQWFRSKYRPVATDLVVTAAARALALRDGKQSPVCQHNG